MDTRFYRPLDDRLIGGVCAGVARGLDLDPTLVRTAATPQRIFQGWRYLPAENAPADLAEGSDDLKDMPPEMLAELCSLGLI